MKLEGIPPLIDEVMHEARQSSTIEIRYERAEIQEGEHAESIRRVLSVNGYTSPEEYRRALEYLGERLEMAASNRAGKLRQALVPVFINEMVRALKSLQEEVISKDSKNAGNGEEGGIISGCVEFRHPVVKIDGMISDAGSLPVPVRNQLQYYAMVWKRNLKNIRWRMKVLGTIIPHIENELTGPADPFHDTIILNTNIRRFAALLRLLFEMDLLVIDRKSDLFNLVSRYFSTRGTKTISPKSFKNHFDSPPADALEYWESTFITMKDAIRDLWMEYYGN